MTEWMVGQRVLVTSDKAMIQQNPMLRVALDKAVGALITSTKHPIIGWWVRLFEPLTFPCGVGVVVVRDVFVAPEEIEFYSPPKTRVEELEDAIRKHRDQKGDDRCWMDDQELYAVLRDGVVADQRLPPEKEMLENCKRYIKLRRHPEEPIEGAQKGRWATADEVAFLEREFKK